MYQVSKLSNLLFSAGLVAMLLHSSAVMAEDTEIYFGGVNSDGVARANVLLILDTSSSMTNTDNTGITRLDRMKTALHTIISNANNVNMGLMRFHKEGGPVLYPVSNLNASTEEAEDAGELEPLSLVYSRVKQSEDDAQEAVSDSSVDLTSTKLSMIEKQSGAAAGNWSVEVAIATQNDAVEEEEDGDMYRGSSDLELVNDNSRGDQTIGLRFQNVSIPAGAIITSAEIEFTIDEYKSEATNLSIVGEKVLFPSSFGSADNSVSNRLANAPTSSTVAWNSVPALAKHAKLHTPNLSSIVSEIIAQPGWQGAHSMAFFIYGSGKRTVESWNNGDGRQPKLRITYTTPAVAAGAAEEQIVGLRFEDVAVPQGATITDAYIEFSAAASNSETTSLVISAENVDDADTGFTNANGNLSARAGNDTSASVDWNAVEPWVQGDHYLTPDLKSVVQEVVNRSGWCGNHAMAFFIQGGSGIRAAVSYDDDTAAAPVLHINYDEASVNSNSCIEQTFQAQITSGGNDVEEKADGTMYSSSSDLELTQDGSTQTIGLRFTNVNIPQGTSIVEAYLDFTAKGSSSGGTSLTIKAEDSADAGPFTSTANDVTNRPTTSASQSWSPGSWTSDAVYSSEDIKTIIQELVNKGAWSAGNALNIIISGSGMRRAWSHNGSPANAPVLRVKVNGELSTGSKTVRDRLHDIVTELNWKSGTPIVDTLYEAALYYRGDEMFYGNTRGNSQNSGTSLSRSEYTRVSHPASYTGGTVVREAGCTDDNLNSTSCRTEKITGTATYISPITLECQNNYVILLSDGQPSVNTSASKVQSMIGGSCSGSGSGQCGPELANFLYNQDQSDNFTGDQTIKTYTIGFNLLEGGKTYLEGVAAAGGGTYEDASSADQLVTAFQNIFASILSRPTSFASPVLSINAFTKLYHNNDIYFSLFKPERSKHWNGNVKKYKVCEGKEEQACTRGEILDANGNGAIGGDYRIKENAQSIWSGSPDGPIIQEGGAGNEVPAYASRRLFTYTGSSSPTNVSLDSSAHAVNTSNTSLVNQLGQSMFGHGPNYNGSETTDIHKVINWMRGQDVMDADEDSSTTEDRWVFSDPLHSSAVPITYGYLKDVNGRPADGGDADEEPDYVVKLMLASNDGTLRMINAHNGTEEWAFIPQVLLEEQPGLMENIDGAHVYGMDSTPTVRAYDANNNGIIEPAGTDVDGNGSIEEDEKDYVHAFISMRRGGRNLYAFDITPSSALSDRNTTTSISPKLLWRIEGGSGNFLSLGQTWSKPVSTSILYNNGATIVAKDVLIFAGGYHTAQDEGFGPAAYGNAIYIVDADTGARLWWASNANANLNLADMTYAIPSDIAPMDSNSDGFVDRLYVGDTGGQVWRIDLSATLNASSGAKLAAISSAADDADKRKFFYRPDVVQMSDGVFSDVTIYDLITLASGNRSHPLDQTVHDRVYAFRDTHTNAPMPATFTALTEADLYDTTDTHVTAGSAAGNVLKTKSGWYLNLQESDDSWKGEKGLSTALVLDGKLFLSTYIPEASEDEDVCGGAVEGSGRLYALDIHNGAAVYDWSTGDGEGAGTVPADRRTSLGDGIPSDAIAVFQESGIDVMVGTGGGAFVVDPKIDLPRQRSFWQQEKVD